MGIKKSKKHIIVPSMASAATTTGLPSATVKAAKEAGCSAFFRNGNVDCDELKKFVAENPGIGKEAMSFSEAERRDKQAVAEIRETKLAQMRRDLILADEMRRDFTRAIFAAKSKFLSLPARLSQRFALMDDAIEIEIELKREIIEALSELSKCEWAKMKCPKCKGEIKA